MNPEQEVINNAYKHSYQLLEMILKLAKDDEKKYQELILMIKNLTYYLEDYFNPE